MLHKFVNMGLFEPYSIVKCVPIKNWSILSMCISTCGCTQEVWRAQKKRKSCLIAIAQSNSSFLSALQTSQVQP